MSNLLPLNRKEAYYTGTVLPGIICAENFKHFHLFLRLVGINDVEVNVSHKEENIQFFTEYNLMQSIHRTIDEERFRKGEYRNDTPDLMIAIKDTSKPYIIAIEAKMFDKPTPKEIIAQCENQKKYVLDNLSANLGTEPIHVCLLPEKMLNPTSSLDGYSGKLHFITWQDIYKTYDKEGLKCYFLNVLKYALENFCNYQSNVDSSGGANANANAKISGSEIVSSSGGIYKMVGRQGGLKGNLFIEDLNQGKWKLQKYEVRISAEKPNDNWFDIEEFIVAAKGAER